MLPLSAPILNTVLLSGIPPQPPFPTPSSLCNTLLLNWLLNFNPPSFLPFNINSTCPPLPLIELIFLFKLHHNRLHFPSPVLQMINPPHYPLRSFHRNNFLIPISRTSAFQSSFLPSTISLWNSLPPAPKETQSPSLFKFLISKIKFM